MASTIGTALLVVVIAVGTYTVGVKLATWWFKVVSKLNDKITDKLSSNKH